MGLGCNDVGWCTESRDAAFRLVAYRNWAGVDVGVVDGAAGICRLRSAGKFVMRS